MQTNLFTSGTLGYHTFRIPALVVTLSGTLLAFAEGRRNSRHDTGAIDIVVRRSRDNGQTFDDMRVSVDGGGNVAGNPAPVVDASTGRIWLLFCRNNATGPGHGLQLVCGRLLIPCDHIVGRDFNQATDRYLSHVILSDDGGETWRLGGEAQLGTNECMAAQLADGRVYLNERNYIGEYRRAFAVSHDQGESFDAFGWHDELIDPICQAAVLSVGGERLVFSNAASRTRERLTVRTSMDGGQSWSSGRVLHKGPAAYSDLCELPDGTLGCLYEAGSEGPYEQLRWARFSDAWLSSR